VNAVNTSLLSQELAPLNAQIEQARDKLEMLGSEMRTIEAELETFSADRQRFDALRAVCDSFDKLDELKAEALFWEGLPEIGTTTGHIEKVRGRIASFEGEISEILEKQTSLQAKIEQKSEELSFLHEEVRIVYDREERRKEEFVVEREASPVAYRPMVMPWTKDAESESRFRRACLTALLICFVMGSLIPLVKVPVPDRSVEMVEIPKRLAMLVKKEAAIPEPDLLPKQNREEKETTEEESKQAKKEPEPSEDKTKSKPEQQKPDNKPKGGDPAQAVAKAAGSNGGGASAARAKAETVGVLAFKNTIKDLMEETPVAKLGTEARLTKQSPRVAGQAVAHRSLVTMQAQNGSSGGIGNAGVSRNIGNGSVDGGEIGIGMGGSGDGDGTGFGFGQVESSIANLEESSRPLSDGVVAGRTDEEIQIIFDRYKAALYRIYNKELRKDPTLRGKMLLRICIEPNGAVSLCDVESTDLASPELVAKIVERIMRFNFGPKEDVPKMTILYPIDFLPAA
jgi:hypothetical protein